MNGELFNVNYKAAQRVMGWTKTDQEQVVTGYEGEFVGMTTWVDDEGDPAMLPDFWNSETDAYKLVSQLARQGVSFRLEPSDGMNVVALFERRSQRGEAVSRSLSEAITFAALRYFGVRIPF